MRIQSIHDFPPHVWIILVDVVDGIQQVLFDGRVDDVIHAVVAVEEGGILDVDALFSAEGFWFAVMHVVVVSLVVMW